jgi:hypothetical protein
MVYLNDEFELEILVDQWVIYGKIWVWGW